MTKRIIFIVALLICLIVGIVTISKHNIRPTESEPTTEQTEPKPTEDLDIKIDNNTSEKEPIFIVIGEDGKIMSESEVEESRAKELDEQLKEDNKTSPSESSLPENADRMISDEEMKNISSNVEEYTHKQTIETFRMSAKTEVARLKAEGKEEFEAITNEMIDSYSEEELNNLMILIYQKLSY